MGVEVIGVGGEINGHGDSMDAFRTANEQNARALLNVAEGKKKNEPRPPFNPDHPDNQWPVMVYSAEKGELTVGKSLVGLAGSLRLETEKNNKAALAQSVKDGYRSEPYIKPQVVVLDPATEKAELKRKNDELQGQITALNDLMHKVLAGQAPVAPTK